MAAAPVQAPALHPRPAAGGRDGNPAYIVAVFVVFGCLLSLVGVAVRKGVCRGRSRGSGQVIHPPSGASFSFLGILFGTPSITPAAAVEVSPYRPSVDSSGGTPRRGLLIDSPCSPGLDQGLVKRLPMVCYKATKHRRQGSGMRGAGAEDLRIESGRGMAEQGQQGSESCSVCLSCFLEGDFLRVLPECGHLFHLDCVDTWLLSRSTCPLCRCEVTGRNPSCSTKLGKLLARFGNGRSFGCSRSRSFSGMDLGSFRSRLGSEHDSFRSRLGTDQDAVITRSSRFIEIDLGELPAEGREAVVQIEDSVKATNARPGNVVEPAGITNLDMASVQPPAPAALRSIFVTSAEAGVGGEGATPQAVSHVQGSSQPISPGRLLVLEPARVPDQ